MTRILKLATFLDTQNGRSLQEAADHFGKSKRSIQRDIQRIELDYQGLKVEHLWGEDFQKRFRCAAGSKLSAKVKKRDVLAIWSLSLAAQVLSSYGMQDDADAILSVQALLLENAPHAERTEFKKRLAILAGGEKVANADRKAVAIQGVVTKLRLAMIHGRSIKLHLKDQTLVEGAVSAIRHSVEMNVTLEGARGSVVIPIGMVSEVSGVDDLLHADYLMAA